MNSYLQKNLDVKVLKNSQAAFEKDQYGHDVSYFIRIYTRDYDDDNNIFLPSCLKLFRNDNMLT